MARFDNANTMLHCKLYYYYNIEFDCAFLLCLEWDGMYSYITLNANYVSTVCTYANGVKQQSLPVHIV
jgi:hypothetical protein